MILGCNTFDARVGFIANDKGLIGSRSGASASAIKLQPPTATKGLPL